MAKIYLLTVALAVLALMKVPAQSAIVSAASSFGANSVTGDTTTQLEWLDFQFSFGNVADIDAQLMPGGGLESWRRATQSEVETLWTNAGIAVTDMMEPATETLDAAQVLATSALMDLIGLSNDGGGSFDFSTGYTAEAGLTAGQQQAAYLMRRFGASDFEASAAVLGAERSDALGIGSQLPSWLVRNFEISAPATLALVLPGLAFFWLRRR